MYARSLLSTLASWRRSHRPSRYVMRPSLSPRWIRSLMRSSRSLMPSARSSQRSGAGCPYCSDGCAYWTRIISGELARDSARSPVSPHAAPDARTPIVTDAINVFLICNLLIWTAEKSPQVTFRNGYVGGAVDLDVFPFVTAGKLLR